MFNRSFEAAENAVSINCRGVATARLLVKEPYNMQSLAVDMVNIINCSADIFGNDKAALILLDERYAECWGVVNVISKALPRRVVEEITGYRFKLYNKGLKFTDLLIFGLRDGD